MTKLQDFDLHPDVESMPYINVISESGTLNDLNIDNELYESYAKAKNYLATLQFSDNVAPNHIAQVFNTINTILREIVKMRTDLYNAERVKKLEFAMIETMKKAPKDLQDVFLEEYKIALGD